MDLIKESANKIPHIIKVIEGTIQRVNDVSIIAKNTAESLGKIILNVTEISNIIEEISNSSLEQSAAVSQAVDEIKQISQVAQNNSATNEETASASEELSSQSQVMKNLVSVFEVAQKPFSMLHLLR